MGKQHFVRARLVSALALLGVFSSVPALAVEPANVRAGPVFLTPTIDTRLGYVDNLFRSQNEEKDTGVSVVKPRLQGWFERGVNTYSLTYELVDYRYFDSGDDDFTDHIFNLDIYQEFNARNAVNMFAEYNKGHEERGTGLTEGIAELIDKPVELDRTLYGGDYTYGSTVSRGRIRLAAKGTEHEYQNFESYTQYRNRDQYHYDGSFFWKVAPKTEALVELRYIDNEYDKIDPADSAGSFDSEEYNYLVGVAWEATARTTGSIRVGMYDRTYDSSARSDDDGFSWEVDVTYSPRTYSSLNLESRRYSDETNGVGDAIDANMTTLTWAHNWNSRSSTSLAFGAGSEDYSGSNRKDDRFDVKASYNYAFRRWIDFGVGYRFEDRDSDLNLFDYSRNEVFLEAKLSM